MLKAIAVVLAVSTSIAVADAPKKAAPNNVKEPKQLLRALKLAGIKPATAKDKWTFKVDKLHCNHATADEDGLGLWSCEIDGKGLTEPSSFILISALDTSGIPSDNGMSQSRYNLTHLVCVDDQNATGDAMYRCTTD
jgi:hypothetical protein